MDQEEEESYLTPAQAARLLHVSPKTIARWAHQGRLACLVTPGGHRRFPREAVVAIAGQMALRGGAAAEE